MTIDLAVITGLSYKATTLQDFANGIFFQISEGRPRTSPETRGSNIVIPYRRGQLLGPRRADRFAIGLTGFVQGSGTTEEDQRSDAEEKLDDLFNLFDVEGGEGTLLCTTPDGENWAANAYPEVFLPAPPDIPSLITISVRLIAIDPPEWTIV